MIPARVYHLSRSYRPNSSVVSLAAATSWVVRLTGLNLCYLEGSPQPSGVVAVTLLSP